MLHVYVLHIYVYVYLIDMIYIHPFFFLFFSLTVWKQNPQQNDLCLKTQKKI